MNIHPYCGQAVLCLIAMTSCNGPSDQAKSAAELNETTLLTDQHVESPSAIVEETSFTRAPHFDEPTGFAKRVPYVKYADLAPPEAIHHRIYSSRDTVIYDGDQLALRIPADAFIYEDGTVPDGDVDFSLQSFLDNFNIINHGLTTTSDGALIETAGMFYCEATCNGRKLELRKPINVSVRTASKKEGMQTFYGQESNGTINWIPAVNNERSGSSKTSTAVASARRSKGGEFVSYEDGVRTKISGYIWDVTATDQRERLRQMQTERPVNWTSRIYRDLSKSDELLWRSVTDITSFTVSMRLLENARYELVITPNNNPVLDSLVRMSTRAYWDDVKYPKKINERDDIRYTNTFYLRMWKTTAEYEAALHKKERERRRYLDSLEARGSDQVATFANDDQWSTLTNYALQITRMGWINCDRFVKVEKKQDVIVMLPPDFKGRVSLAFNSVRSFMSGYISAGKVYFQGVPAGEEFTIVCFDANEKGELLMTKQKGVADGTEYVAPKGRPVTLGQLQREMAAL